MQVRRKTPHGGNTLFCVTSAHQRNSPPRTLYTALSKLSQSQSSQRLPLLVQQNKITKDVNPRDTGIVHNSRQCNATSNCFHYKYRFNFLLSLLLHDTERSLFRFILEKYRRLPLVTRMCTVRSFACQTFIIYDQVCVLQAL